MAKQPTDANDPAKTTVEQQNAAGSTTDVAAKAAQADREAKEAAQAGAGAARPDAPSTADRIVREHEVTEATKARASDPDADAGDVDKDEDESDEALGFVDNLDVAKPAELASVFDMFQHMNWGAIAGAVMAKGQDLEKDVIAAKDLAQILVESASVVGVPFASNARRMETVAVKMLNMAMDTFNAVGGHSGPAITAARNVQNQLTPRT